MTRAKSKQTAKILADMRKLADELRKAPGVAEKIANEKLAGEESSMRLAYRVGALEQIANNIAGGIDIAARHLADELRLQEPA